MQTLKSGNILEILVDKKVITAFNKMASMPFWHEVLIRNIENINSVIVNDDSDPVKIIEELFFVSTNSNVHLAKKYFVHSKRYQVAETTFQEIVEADKLRIYSDDYKKFTNVQLREMRNLNDPMEGLWLYTNASPSTIYINQILKSAGTIFASYSTPAISKNETYMCSNYSKRNKGYIEFEKKNFIKNLDALEAYYGYVIYSKPKIAMILTILRRIIGAKGIFNAKTPMSSSKTHLVYFAIEFLLNSFYKWNIMSPENEFRAIKIFFNSTKPTSPINLPTRLTKGKCNVTITDENIFYKLRHEIDSK